MASELINTTKFTWMNLVFALFSIAKSTHKISFTVFLSVCLYAVHIHFYARIESYLQYILFC